MNCPRCGAPDFTQTCGACYLLTPRAIQDVQTVLTAIKGRSSVQTADLVRMLTASDALKPKDVQAILKGVFKQHVDVVSLAAAASVAAPASASPATPEQIRLLLRSAEAHENAGDHAEAERILRAIVRERPSHMSACRQLGLFLYKRGRRDEGQKYLTQAIKAPAQTTEELFEKAALLSAGFERFREAIACLETLVGDEPSHVAALTLKGDIHVYLSEFDKATSCYTRAQAARPDDRAIASKMEALIAFQKGAHANYRQERAPALEWFSKAVELEPRNFAYLLEKGILLWEMKRHGEALVLLDRGLELAHRSASLNARWAKFSALAEVQLVADAQTFGRQFLSYMTDGPRKQFLVSYLQIEPPNVTRQQIAGHWVTQGRAALQEKRFQDAQEYFNRALYVNPSDSVNKGLLGLSLVLFSVESQRGALEAEGLAYFTEALAAKRDPVTLFNYMQALHVASRLSDALRVADELLALTPGDPLVLRTASAIRKKMQ